MLKFGKTSSEIVIEGSVVAREIVNEVMNFGVSQPQLIQIIYLLSLELESRDALVAISKCVQEHINGTKELESKITLE